METMAYKLSTFIIEGSINLKKVGFAAGKHEGHVGCKFRVNNTMAFVAYPACLVHPE